MQDKTLWNSRTDVSRNVRVRRLFVGDSWRYMWLRAWGFLHIHNTQTHTQPSPEPRACCAVLYALRFPEIPIILQPGNLMFIQHTELSLTRTTCSSFIPGNQACQATCTMTKYMYLEETGPVWYGKATKEWIVPQRIPRTEDLLHLTLVVNFDTTVLGIKNGNSNKTSSRTQECIPVGCVPSAAVAVPGGGGVPAQEGCLPKGVSARERTPPPGQTDDCENKTFPQLLLRTVITQRDLSLYGVWRGGDDMIASNHHLLIILVVSFWI